MSNADPEERRSLLPGNRPLPTGRPEKQLDPATAVDLISTGARLLFENGQTTERMVAASEQLAEALGVRATLFPSWASCCCESKTTLAHVTRLLLPNLRAWT
jgi:hypothetical protein